ncbi:MAG: beta-ketoacyl synthase [Planctomycetota bacterium]|nr:MAG: beta-ketoacyl synthase [Planctomycetota bacterium]
MSAAPHDTTNDSPSRDVWREPLAIVGIGCLFPGADSLDSYWANIRAGVDCITEVPPTHWNAADYFSADPAAPDMTYARRGGFLDAYPFDPLRYGISPNNLEATDATQLLGLVVAEQALRDAGYSTGRDAADGRPFDRDRTSVILGVTGTLPLVIPLGARLGHPLWRKALAEAGVPKEVADDVVARIADGYVPWQENSFPGLLGNVAAGRIANRFDLGGTNCVVDSACASSLSALHMAAMELHAGRADMVLSGGFDTFNDIFMYMCFSKTPALSPTGDSKPFAADGDGTILGEGLGMVVLKRLSDARRDGDRVYAAIRGIGSSSDGRGNAIYAPSAAGQKKALRSAYRVAGVSPRTIELVEAHGTGTKVGDLTETTSLAEVFREEGGGGTWCAVGSVKSMIGHTKAAAGVAGLIKAAMALNDKVLPPTLKVDEPLEPLLPGNSPAYANTLARPWVASENHPRRAALSAFGFGGSNFHCVLEEAEPARATTRWDGRVQILAFSGATPRALEDQLAAIDAQASWKDIRNAAARSRTVFDGSQACRLTIVVERDRTGVAKLVAGARRMLAARNGEADESAHRSTPDGAYCASGPRRGKLAVLFPGQGSQYVYMQLELACQFPEALAALEAMDRTFGRGEPGERLRDYLYPPPVFCDADRAAQDERLRATEIAQPALGAASLGAWRVIESFGMSADAFAGHSFGELVALCAAGRIGERDFGRLAVERGRAMSAASAGRGAMLAVVASAGAVREALAAAKLNLTLANHNGPAQVVLSGEAEEIARAAAWFGERNMRTVKLPVSAAFHSPLVAGAEAVFARAVAEVDFSAGTTAVFSNTTAAEYPREAEAARKLLARQLAQPVKFVDEIEALYAAGVRTFVEVGPQAKLAALVRAILGNRPHAAVATDNSAGRRSGQFDLACALAELAVLGERVELAKWDPQKVEQTPAKKPGLIVPLTGANYVKPRPARPKREGTWDSGVGSRDSGSVHGEPQRADRKTPVEPVPHTEHSIPSPAVQSPSPPLSERPRVLPESRIPNPESLPDRPAPLTQPAMELDQALRLNEQSILALERMQEQTAQLHRQYLEGQLIAQRTVEQLIEQQQWLLGAALGGSGRGTRDAGRIRDSEFGTRDSGASLRDGQESDRSQALPVPATRAAQPIATRPIGTAPAPVAAAPVAGTPRIATPAAPSAVLFSVPSESSVVKEPTHDLATALLEIVAEKTGYPPETLDLDMSLDADLGIDSIKRVEIMSAVQERLPDAPAVRPDDLGRLQTLREIVDFLAANVPLGAPPPPSSVSSVMPSVSSVFKEPRLPARGFTGTLLEVVAEKTGYPVEALELDMSLDADLGIDSIKRVEILSALQERMPDAPAVKPDDLGRLQTLRQIVAFLDDGSAGNGTSAGAAANPTLPAAPASDAALPVEENVAPAAVGESAAENLTRRVLRLAPISTPRPPIALDRAAEFWIAGEGELAEALRRELIARRVVARVVPLDAVLGDRPVCGLCIVAPGKDAATAVKHRRGKASSSSADPGRFVAEAFGLLQRSGPGLRKTGRTSAAVLATVSHLGGGFAIDGAVGDEPITGALAGLVKTAGLEWPEVHAKAIDVEDTLDVETLARRIADELLVAGPIEVGIAGEGPLCVELVGEAPGRSGRTPLGSRDVVVVSGGARGVAAESAVALAAKYGCTLLLLGRSPEPTPEPTWATGLVAEVDIKRAIVKEHAGPIAPKVVEFQCRRLLASREIARTLARIEAAGGQAAYRSVDVRDAAALGAVLADAREHLGPIRGVVHAAGVLADRLIEDKTDEQFADVWSTKVDGALALLGATAGDDLAVLAFFSSSTARFGRKGQIDYAAANEALNKLAQREASRRSGCRVVSINWGPWDGGMVTPALKKLFAAEGVGVIGLSAGAQFLADELTTAPGGPVEIVVLGPQPASADAVATPHAKASAESLPQPREAKPTAALHRAFERELSVDACPVLRSHVINGRAVLPMALMVEWLAHAALHDNPGLEFLGLDDLRVFKGVILEPDQRLLLRAVASAPEAHEGAEIVQVELHSGSTLHARARVVLGDERGSGAPTLAFAGGGALADPNVYDGVRLFHGGDLHGIVRVETCGEAGIVADTLTAPPPAAWIREPLRNRWLADPLALDAAFQLMIVWCFEQRGIGSLPTRLGRYRQFVRAFPAAGVRTTIRVDRQGPHQAEATIEFTDAAGKLVARIEGYECVLDASLGEAFARNALPAEVS